MKIASAALTLSVLTGTAAAFAPRTHLHRRTKTTATSQSTFTGTNTASALSAVALETPPLAPKTLWGEKISDIRKMQQAMRQQELPEFAITVSATKDLGLKSDDVDAQLEYVRKNAMDLKQKMQDHGCVIFRDFDLMKSQQGFQDFYNALGMKVCLDPLHSVSARPTVDGQKNSPVYEAVNKESRKNFFIGAYRRLCPAVWFAPPGGWLTYSFLPYE